MPIGEFEPFVKSTHKKEHYMDDGFYHVITRTTGPIKKRPKGIGHYYSCPTVKGERLFQNYDLFAGEEPGGKSVEELYGHYVNKDKKRYINVPKRVNGPNFLQQKASIKTPLRKRATTRRRSNRR